MKTRISVHLAAAEASSSAAMVARARFISLASSLPWILIRNLKACGFVQDVLKAVSNSLHCLAGFLGTSARR